jgi:hypothetical protein
VLGEIVDRVFFEPSKYQGLVLESWKKTQKACFSSYSGRDKGFVSYRADFPLIPKSPIGAGTFL